MKWHLLQESSHYLQRTGISLRELPPDTKVHEAICADVNHNDTARDQTANLNAWGGYILSVGRDAKIVFLNDLEQPTRHNPASGAFSSPDVTIVHAALGDRYDCEPLHTLSSNHCPVLITIHLPTEKLTGLNGSFGIGRRCIWPFLPQQLMNSWEEVD